MTNKNKIINNSVSFDRQSGFSLVELMISALVGLFLLAGVVTNFLSTTNADKKRAAVSEMDANATLAFEVLRQSIAHAGYASIENIVPFDSPFYTPRDGTLSNTICGDGTQRDGVGMTPNSAFRTRDINATGRDFLTVVTLGDNPCNAGFNSCTTDTGLNVNEAALVYTDCGSLSDGSARDSRAVACSTDPVQGMENPADARIYSTFKLFKTNNNKDRVLYCYGSRSGEQAIVDNVEAIQYLYGVREDGTGNIRFLNATQVNSGNIWGTVTSVKVGLLLRSSNQYVLDIASEKKKYQVLDNTISVPAADLKRLFRVYTTTINLENKNKGALLPSG